MTYHPKIRTQLFLLNFRFLKLNNIEYVHEEEHALKGLSKTAPWMTFNKENYPDSQKCIDLLASKFEIDLFKGMSEEDKAISNSFKIMIEDRLIPCLDIERFYWKKWDDYKDLIPPFTPPALNFLSSTLWNMLGKGSKKKWGVGALPKEKLEEATSGYLDTLSKFLGTKKFMFGDEITLIDIIIFGVLTLFYYCTPEGSKMKEIAESFANLKEHNQRMKEKIWPDGF